MTDSTVKALAQYAHDYLHGGASRQNGALWIWTDSRERGVDIAREIHKLKFGAFTTTVVPEDTLPAAAYNPELGRAVYILCQQDHVETVLVSMYDDTTADLLSVDTARDESLYWSRLAQGKLPEAEKGKLDYLDQGLTTREFAEQGSKQGPVILFVDEKHADWKFLKRYMGTNTEVKLTDRVKTRPPEKSATDKLREELGRRSQRYRH